MSMFKLIQDLLAPSPMKGIWKRLTNQRKPCQRQAGGRDTNPCLNAGQKQSVFSGGEYDGGGVIAH
ncbi:MAG: hypothetical protein LIP16_00175 [Clostridium sp.]|nr:hypothetical protein [Clostridium sp.]